MILTPYTRYAAVGIIREAVSIIIVSRDYNVSYEANSAPGEE